MPDYSLGRAHGKIEIDYAGSGADKAAKDIDRVAVSSDKMDESLSKSQKTLRDTEKEFDRAGGSAERHGTQIHGVSDAHTGLHEAHQRTGADLQDFSKQADKASDSATGLSKALKVAADGAAVFGGEEDGASEGLKALSKAFSGAGASSDEFAGRIGDSLSSVISQSGQHIRDFVKDIAGFEKSFAKISGVTLAVPSLGGLAGLGGAAGVQGVTEMADALRQLSGALGLLPAAVSGVGFSLGTLKVAFHGVGQAIKDMMADDPKKFLDDIKNMGPVAAQSMLQVAQFRNQFKTAGAAVQDSFFKQIGADIQPLITTWLPAVTKGMSEIATVFGQAAHQLAGLLGQPAAMQAFQAFVGNVAKGLQSLQPAMAPLLDIFTRLTTVGSSFFGEIGQRITQMLGFFDQIITKAQASGALQQWIQSGIDAFSRLVNVAYLVGSAFNTIFDTAEKFGGGGFLGWLQQVTGQFDAWTKSVGGQNTLQQFFAATEQAMTAFAPMIAPIAQGIGSLLTAFVKLGVATAPGWQTFFTTFAQTMGQLGPQLQAMAPTINQLLTGLSHAFAQLMASVGPQLPQMFQGLANAFLALLPQIQPLAQAFVQLVEQVGPQLPKFFESVTGLIIALMPYLPTLIGLIRDVVSAFTGIIQGAGGFTNAITTLIHKVGDLLMPMVSEMGSTAGKALIKGLADGLADATGFTWAKNALTNVLHRLGDLLPKSPAKEGPFSGDGWTYVRGQKIVTDLAAGVLAAQPAMTAAARSTVAAASSALSGITAAVGAAATGGAGVAAGAAAPAPGGAGTTGQALLPDNIASADTNILRAYEKHQFDDNRGLKGLSKTLGQALQLSQTGFNLLNQYVASSLFSAIGATPGGKATGWRKMTPTELAAQLQANAAKDTTDPTWGAVLGAGSPGAATLPQQTPLGLTASSSKEDIQKAIIAAGKARGLSDSDVQTALAVAAAESGFNPASPTQMQGGHPVGGLYQQGPAFGTADQVLDPNFAINAFYNAYAQQLAKNPTNPLLAAVLTQNPQLGAAAKGSDYWNAVTAQLGLANSIYTAYSKTAPSWQQLGAGLGAAPAQAPSGVSVAENPASRATQVPNAPNVEAGIRAIGGLPTLYPTSGPGAYQVPGWAQQLASAFGLTASTYASGGSLHQMGYAFDFNGPSSNREAFAKFISQNLAQQTLQLIYRGSQDYGIASGQTTAPGYYAGDLPGHTDHVHWATDQPPIFMNANGQPVPVAGVLPTSPLGAQPLLAPGTSGAPAGGLLLPNGQTLDQITANTGKSADANQQLLQAYLQGNPLLAQQIQAAQTPGAPDKDVTTALHSIGTTIEGLKSQDAVGNKATIDALSDTQNKIASQQGYTSGSSTLSSVQGALGGAAQAITGAFQTAQSVLDAMSSTQDITDRLVYGISNTQDIQKLIDDVQSYITVASNVAYEAGNVLSAVGNIASVANYQGADPGQAISAAGTVSQLIGGALAGVNATIDYGQQIYEIAMGYVGQFMSYLTAGPGGTPLMGDVQFLLNTNTGQELTSSLNNPQNQNTLTVPQLLQGLYGMGAYGPSGGNNPNPGVRDVNFYAGPGQSPAQMWNEAMWMVNTGGIANGVGAMAASNF